MTEAKQPVRIGEEIVEIPTYGVGKADKNPMFLEKRVYQGSSGRVYPHPVIDKIEDEKAPKPYTIIVLENEYLRIEVMPEIGGRIYRALDKTNHYDFVYYNRVIKPALVGLAGPWISGGIEFNWPQHHRPNTFGPVEYRCTENEDGSATVWVSEIDRMYGTKMTAGYTLYPEKAYLEIAVQLYNRTPEPQTFLWWANPAVAVNEHTQSVFPPDVTAVFDHGKRDVSRFPIATGTYYKTDYSEGVDISRYKNIPVPTSYMAYKSDYNFVGGYDHGVQAGLLHVADHHISPGKKQWTWGNGDFGQAWDRNLTDEDGPYIELMTGVYTDNQPDFTWLQPYEEKSFKQYFMPYKHIGVVKNASIDAAVNVEVDESLRQAVVQVYATYEIEDARIIFKGKKSTYVSECASLSPTITFQTVVALDGEDQAHDLVVKVQDRSGRVLISYQPKEPQIERVPDAAKPMPEPEELTTNEQLYLAGLHLEQYRHATFEPEAYYLEGLKRDAGDSRIHIAYGTLLRRRGLYEQSERHFRKAVTSLTWRNPNPYDSEAYYQLGLSLKLQGRMDEAYRAFHKAVWSAAWQDSGYFALAQISCSRGSYHEAMEHVERSLLRNARNYKARHLKTALLRKLARWDEALEYANETLRLDIADFGALFEMALIYEEMDERERAIRKQSEFHSLTRGDVHNVLALTADYAECGLYTEAAKLGMRNVEGNGGGTVYPMVFYTLGYLEKAMGRLEEAASYFRLGSEAVPDYCFPNTLFELAVLEAAIHYNAKDAKAHYYLGNLLYDKKRAADAIRHWEASREADATFATVHRNLALAYYNKLHDAEKARVSMEAAFRCNPDDARVFYELDQLYKKLGIIPRERLEKLAEHLSLVQARDDLYLEYVTLHNSLKQHQAALKLLLQRKFHPWEGGEGKVTGQYVNSFVQIGKTLLQEGRYSEALAALQQAQVYPENLGEGKLAGAQENHIYYYLGCCYEGVGDRERAGKAFAAASQGQEEPASAMFYNDSPPDLIYYQGLACLKLGQEGEARRRFNKLVDYGERHLFDEIKIDYFAVSLPDFLVFDDDLNLRNRIHCYYMIGLGYLGLSQQKKAQQFLKAVLQLDPSHQGALSHLE
ncbi:DUF5107 domain-containing protein [Paenibacillus turpanensis]|uniref:DUF5107 domain-containing protein n=1 Tax=Paenibacillus turpanensis TaxID=2689078 RepID=UPI00140D5D25|nr:DUF5107 domain-containing protein [Paenibacillus turpanensis]